MEFQALILTRNEEINIADCLRSLRSLKRIVLIDSESTDATVDIARRDPRVTILRRPFCSFSDQRNHGLESAFDPGTWVLHLDADERLTPSLYREIRRLPPRASSAYNIASMTYLRRRAIPRASGYPVYQTRLTRAGDFRFVEVGHGQKAPLELGPLPCLRHHYEHHPFEKGLIEWLCRHERYAELEARAILNGDKYAGIFDILRDPIKRRQFLKQVIARAPGRPAIIYAYHMYIRMGFLEGTEGKDYCRLRGTYEALVDLKLNELLHARRK